ncbi:hypothetical protein [Herbaspirillum sp. alder98]|uniref:hypothetical protein n=1 Tax=Herbaspirillum sp. alder98 TaxID=2913096 RepID=UPI001CD90D41|nr:hypothetical protein [Herbaspirillum sp. alder98]MCA1324583.1 hypothetical protein [Herbaspirillum sp. alder98]
MRTAGASRITRVHRLKSFTHKDSGAIHQYFPTPENCLKILLLHHHFPQKNSASQRPLSTGLRHLYCCMLARFTNHDPLVLSTPTAANRTPAPHIGRTLVTWCAADPAPHLTD